MRINDLKIKILLPISLILLITSCDHNSDNRVTDVPVENINNSNSNSSVTDDIIDNIIQIDEEQAINQSIDLLLHFPFDTVGQIKWQQTAGEPVTILAKNSKVVSFVPSRAGDYSFSVSFTLNNGIEQTLEKTVTVSDDSNKLTSRLSHAVLAENKVSLRSELHNTININTLVWQQIKGPDVTLTTDNSNGKLAIFFDAPQVDIDTIITFKVSATDDSNNTTYYDKVAVLVEPTKTINSNAYFSDRKARVFAYNSDSPYAENLETCIYSNDLTSSCTLIQTPLIAKEVKSSSATPSVENIMDRVVVSHQWMGDRFKDFITTNDPHNDMKNLLRATTAIVIAYDIRPSFYWAATGAIYLDAENFWLTPQERDTINEAPDFRADFGNDLQFLMPWRYVKNNAYASRGYSKATRVTRSPADALYRLTSLMYHELAHANDFFPSNEWYIHSSEQRVLDAAVSSNFESDKLAISLPLTSQEMRNLGQVSFAGETATQTQKNYLPVDIEGFFSPDRASDFYAYSSLREDYATLFEELMMQNRFAVIRDVAITNQPSGNNISATDYIVTWGQRGRIGDEKLRDRVIFSASRVLPEFDSQAAMNLVPAPIEMLEGKNWLDNLTISPTQANTSNKIKNRMRTRMRNITTETEPVNNSNRYYQKPLPDH